MHEKHRGKKTGGRKKKQWPQAMSVNPIPLPSNARKVVQIDRYGAEIQRFDSIGRAAREILRSACAIRRRCYRETWINFDEFESFGSTFRFADEWDAMSAEERKREIKAAGGRIKEDKE